jgi:Flp pilus assembly protein TadD
MSGVSAPASPASRRWHAAVLVAAVAVVYANSLQVPFVFDDAPAITGNPTIRQLGTAFAPPGGQGLTVEGRPVLNVSLALNYAAGGTAVAGYHLVNLAIHAGAALLLCAVVRRTLTMLAHPAAGAIAFFTALLWAVHPLQTEAVTYTVQRTESLMGLCLLATLYTFIRGAEATSGRSARWRAPENAPGRAGLPAAGRTGLGWFVAAFALCAIGMATKEVMVAAPVLVLLYDRTFLAGSFGEALRRRGGVHAALFATWLLLAALVLGAGDRGGTIGAAAGVAWYNYALCQFRAVIHYVRLAFWPDPLVFDYGPDFVSPATAAPYAALVLALVAATAVALRRKPALGFVGAWFFVILAPTSSVVGGTRQMLAEHRIYLSLAAVVLLVVLAGERRLGRRGRWLWAGLALALGGATIARNADYRSELALYADTVAKRPDNPYARYNLGKALAEAGRYEEAIGHDREAVRLRPQLVGAQYNLANALAELGRLEEARTHYAAAVALKPDYAKAHFNLGNVLRQLGRPEAALAHYRAAVQHDAGQLEARDNLGGLLLERGELAEAEVQFTAVLRAHPASAGTWCNLGTLCWLQGRTQEAEAHYTRALQLDPRLTFARDGLERVRRGVRP